MGASARTIPRAAPAKAPVIADRQDSDFGGSLGVFDDVSMLHLLYEGLGTLGQIKAELKCADNHYTGIRFKRLWNTCSFVEPRK